MTLLYFAPVHWDSYPQRPHYVVQHFLKSGGSSVVWIEPYPTRLPRLGDLQRIRSQSGIGPDRPANLRVVSLRALPFEPTAAGGWINRTFLWTALARRVRPWLAGGDVAIGIGRPSALALAALTELRPSWSFYDAMDDFPEFYSGLSKRSVESHERRIVRAVDVIATASSALWLKFQAAGPRRRMFHNAFEMAPLPPLATTRHDPHVFGYVGCVGAWFDWALVVQLADAVPDAAVRIVGPRFARPPRHLPPNIQLLPACSAARTIEHLQGFSVGLIPFKRIALTAAIDPIKYYAYRGMGLTVLSSAFGEMARRGLGERTFLVEAGGAVAAAATAAREAGSAAGSSVLTFRRDHTWERRMNEAGLFDRLAS
jgi:hypothetical protein